MKNKIFAVLTIFIFCIIMMLPVGAVESVYSGIDFVPVERTLGLVVDNADILTSQEEIELEEKLAELGNANEIEVGVVTVNSYNGKLPQDFADDFYDYNGYGYGENDDGLIIVFNTGRADYNRNIALSTHGKAIRLVNDAEMNEIFDIMIPYLSAESYVEAFDFFVIECEKAIDTTMPFYYILLSLAVGFIIALIVVCVQASKLKTVRQQMDASDYVGNVVITGQTDNFMYKNLKRIPIPKSNSSSTHRSSSGRSHGGGSRSF